VPIKWFRKIIFKILVIINNKISAIAQMESNRVNNNWDAETYHKVSNIQESWAIEILEKRKFKVNEIVLDAEDVELTELQK
jgi:hypothetical protein